MFSSPRWFCCVYFRQAYRFIGGALGVDTAELNESGKLNLDFIDMFRFVHRCIHLYLNLMRSLFQKMYAEQAVDFFLQLCVFVKRYVK